MGREASEGGRRWTRYLAFRDGAMLQGGWASSPCRFVRVLGFPGAAGRQRHHETLVHGTKLTSTESTPPIFAGTRPICSRFRPLNSGGL